MKRFIETHTKNGTEIEIYKKTDLQIIGAIIYQDPASYPLRQNSLLPASWDADTGEFVSNLIKKDQGFDLMEIEEPPNIIHINIDEVDEGRFSYLAYTSREDADRAAIFERVACVELQWRKGDGLQQAPAAEDI